MNIRQQFESLLNPKRRMTAKITGGKVPDAGLFYRG